MGKPIKIVQMAKDLINVFLGFEPEIDIPIVYSGLRPGEKLYEELQLINEKKIMTDHKKITILKQKEPPLRLGRDFTNCKELKFASEELNKDTILIILKQLLPTYSPSQFNVIKESPSRYTIKGEA